MIIFALDGPKKYETLIDALTKAIDYEPKHETKTKYQSLIDEINRSLSARVGVQSRGHQVYRYCFESEALLH